VGRNLNQQKQAILAALNQAPEILYLGELRDSELMELAMDAACNGSLVLATLSTSTPSDTVDHIVGAFPTDRQTRIRDHLADALKAVVCQTLLKAIGGGQAVAVETAFVNSTLAELIREGKTTQIPGAMKGGRYGQMLHNDALVKLILNERVDPMEAYLKCHDRESFIAACKKADIPFDPRSDGKVTAN
jgi:twitching motility protein PilT